MKAVFINGKEDIELKEIEEISTQNNPEKVLIEVKYMGICGSVYTIWQKVLVVQQ
ncbi:hypothetical protein J4710_03765 [Staphylococcus xylosus]|uniref:Alcohol dehydrogenase n=1 Tax=Staphylococcus xylosus TaxID=1288 RepID=A0A939NGV7_STAXY|nr:hypothetical protein [Staphylococcus xylosus]